MGFWDIVNAGLQIASELAKASTEKIVNWVNEAQENGAAGVFLQRRKGPGVWQVQATAVDVKGRTLATGSWTIERASGIKRFVSGEVGGGTEYEQGMSDLFEGKDEIFYNLTGEDIEEGVEEEEEDDFDYDEEEDFDEEEDEDEDFDDEEDDDFDADDEDEDDFDEDD